VSPSERGRVIHPAPHGRFRDRLAADQGPRLILPAIRVVQSSQRRSGQRIECLAAAHAAIPGLAAGLAPRTNVVATAMRASKAGEPTLPDLGQQILAACSIDGPRANNRRHCFGLDSRHRRNRNTVVRCTRIMLFGQGQFLKRPSPLRCIQTPNTKQPGRECHCIHCRSPSPRRRSIPGRYRLHNKSEIQRDVGGRTGRERH